MSYWHLLRNYIADLYHGMLDISVITTQAFRR